MHFRLFLTLLALTAVVSAKDSSAALRQVDVSADADANQGSATAVDLVFFYDRAGAAAAPKTGPEWFAQKSAILSRLGPTVDVVSLQVPPGSALSAVALPSRHRRAVAVQLYANYVATDGQPVLNLSSFRHALVRLLSATIHVAEYREPARRCRLFKRGAAILKGFDCDMARPHDKDPSYRSPYESFFASPSARSRRSRSSPTSRSSPRCSPNTAPTPRSPLRDNAGTPLRPLRPLCLDSG